MKSVLISGGSGSFGNAFVKRILEQDPERVVVYSRDEQKQEHMARSFSSHRNFGCLRFFIGDIRDVDRLHFAMHGISTVVHAAALKIVPTAEYNPTECIATNVTGAENVVKASIRAGVERVVSLSTDKAVNPINLYGASKLAAEKIFIAANSLAAGATRFSVVRYGNVVGSRGSVVPLFKQLALEGKPLPITDKRMTRFWMTLEQSVDLVILCHENMSGREIFVSKIPSIKIIDLAEAISGNTFWLETGIRPGEKLNEVLITEDESRNALNCAGFFVLYPTIKPGDITPVPRTTIGSGTLNFLPEGFRYTSDNNTEWLSVDQLKVMMK